MIPTPDPVIYVDWDVFAKAAQEAALKEAKRRTRVHQQPCIFDLKPKKGETHKHWSEK